MSQIIDALRKLDREKKTRGDKPAKISVALPNSNARDPGKKIRPYLAVAGFMAVAAAALYAVALGLGILPNSLSVRFVPPVQSGESGPAAALDSREPGPNSGEQRVEISLKLLKDGEGKNPRKSGLMSIGHGIVKRPTQVVEETEPDETSPETPEQAENEIQRTPANLPNYLDGRSNSPPVDPMGRPLIRRRDRALSGNKTTPDEKLGAQSEAPAPVLKLSAIIWYEEPSKRRAAVNGKILSEGSSIQGVRVVEIRPTSVLFSQNGQLLEISINR